MLLTSRNLVTISFMHEHKAERASHACATSSCQHLPLPPQDASFGHHLMDGYEPHMNGCTSFKSPLNEH